MTGLRAEVIRLAARNAVNRIGVEEELRAAKIVQSLHQKAPGIHAVNRPVICAFACFGDCSSAPGPPKFMEWGLIRLEGDCECIACWAAARCPATWVDFALWVCPQYSFLDDRPTCLLSQAAAKGVIGPHRLRHP